MKLQSANYCSRCGKRISKLYPTVPLVDYYSTSISVTLGQQLYQSYYLISFSLGSHNAHIPYGAITPEV